MDKILSADQSKHMETFKANLSSIPGIRVLGFAPLPNGVWLGHISESAGRHRVKSPTDWFIDRLKNYDFKGGVFLYDSSSYRAIRMGIAVVKIQVSADFQWVETLWEISKGQISLMTEDGHKR